MKDRIVIPNAAGGWSVPWDALQSFPWARAWREDVWEHTRMALERLVADPQWRAASSSDRAITYLASLLHDIAKSGNTQIGDDGRVTSRGNARRGAIDARVILWQMGYPFAVREATCALIRHHQAPYYLIDQERPIAHLLRIAQSARCDLLQMVARADVEGRGCSDRERLLHNVELFGLLAKEQECWQTPASFASEHARFSYFRGREDARTGPLFDDTRCEVVLMCGLPGVGKDHWILEHGRYPVVSLDAIRSRMGIEPSGNQGPVRQAALSRAREHLRASESFIWNATNLPAQRRAQLIGLFSEYRARIRIVYREVPYPRQRRQNKRRKQLVPESVIRTMLTMWEVPDLTEAHFVDYVVDDPPQRFARSESDPES